MHAVRGQQLRWKMATGLHVYMVCRCGTAAGETGTGSCTCAPWCGAGATGPTCRVGAPPSGPVLPPGTGAAAASNDASPSSLLRLLLVSELLTVQLVWNSVLLLVLQLLLDRDGPQGAALLLYHWWWPARVV